MMFSSIPWGSLANARDDRMLQGIQRGKKGKCASGAPPLFPSSSTTTLSFRMQRSGMRNPLSLKRVKRKESLWFEKIDLKEIPLGLG